MQTYRGTVRCEKCRERTPHVETVGEPRLHSEANGDGACFRTPEMARPVEKVCGKCGHKTVSALLMQGAPIESK